MHALEDKVSCGSFELDRLFVAKRAGLLGSPAAIPVLRPQEVRPQEDRPH